MSTKGRLRTRRRGRGSSILSYYAPYYPYHLYGDVDNPDWAAIIMDETMADEYDSPKMGLWKDHFCSHSKIEGSTELVKPWYPGGTIRYVPKTFYWYASKSQIMAVVPSVPAELLDELAYVALEKFKDDISEEGSLLNFLYELKDFGGLIQGFLTSLRSFLLNFSKPGLSWEFFIKPFIEDLQKIFGSFAKVKRRIEFLKKHNGKTVQLNHTVKDVQDRMDYLLFVTPNPVLGTLNFPLPQAGCHVENVKITFRAHAIVKIDCKGLDRWDRQLDAYVEALGLRTLFQWIKAGYKAIPFSWLIDWAVKTNRIFDQLKTPVFGGIGNDPIKVLTTSHSIRTSCKVVLWGDEYHDGPRQVGEYKVKSFRRAPGLPFSGGGVLRYHDLSENASMLAILLQILLPGFGSGKR